jgi:triphosphatase
LAQKICRGPALRNQAENPADTAPAPVIELEVDPADLPKLWRAGPLASGRQGRTRTVVYRRIWHDTAGFALRGHGLALSEQHGIWRLERLNPDGAAAWPPAGPAPILAEAPDLAMLSRKMTPAIVSALVPIAAFTGTRRSLHLHTGGAPARLEILQGALRGVAHDEPACRLILSGPGPAMAALATALSGAVRLSIPRAGLAARAIALAQGTAPSPRQLGAPEIPHGLTVSDALVLVISHLTDVILHWAAVVPAHKPGANAEPVHQMRVAVRRLRSALAIFRRATIGQDSTALFRSLGHALRALAAILGAARDWDVFLAGTGAEIGAAFSGDKRVTALLAAASRKRATAYAAVIAHLASPAWHDLALRLALLPAARPWSPPVPALPERDEFGELRVLELHANLLAASAEAYASQALHRSLKRVTSAGEDLSALSPDALHEARKNGKQLRYACEFFAPLFPAKPTRRFLERLEDLQEALGAVNDSHVAASLMDQLSAGADGRFASGVVLGYVAATSAPAARRAGKAWSKLLKQPVFWT